MAPRRYLETDVIRSLLMMIIAAAAACGAALAQTVPWPTKAVCKPNLIKLLAKRP